MVFKRYFQKKQSFDPIWENISKNCFKNHSIPVELKAIWEEKSKGYSLFKEYPFSHLTFFDTYPEDLFNGYKAEFIGSKDDPEDIALEKSYSKIFDEIGFFATDEMGCLYGLWFYKKETTSLNAPVIIIDHEGQLYLISQNIHHFLPSFLLNEGVEENKISSIFKLINKLYKKYDINQINTLDEIDFDPGLFPDPDKKFDAYFNQFMGKKA